MPHYDGALRITGGRLIWYNICMKNEMFEKNLPPRPVYGLADWNKGV